MIETRPEFRNGRKEKYFIDSMNLYKKNPWICKRSRPLALN